MKIRTKIETAQALKESIELNVDYARDGIALFNRRFPYPQQNQPTKLTEMVNAICRDSRDMSPLTGTPILPTNPEIEKTFSFIGIAEPTTGMHVYSVDKFLDGWAVLAYTVPGEKATLRLLGTSDFKHFKPAGTIKCSDSTADVVFSKVHIAEETGYVQVVYKIGSTYKCAFHEIVQHGETNANGGEQENPKAVIVPHNVEHFWVECYEGSEWMIAANDGTVYSRFGYNRPLAITEAHVVGRSLYIGGIWKNGTIDEYRIIKIEYGGDSTILIDAVSLPTTNDLFAHAFYIINGIPYVVACGTSNVYHIAFDDYVLVDSEVAESIYLPLSHPTDTSIITGAIAFEGRLILGTMNGLSRYDVTSDEWNSCKIANIATGYNSGFYGMCITAEDDLFITISANNSANPHYGFTIMKLPYENLAVKGSLLPTLANTFGKDSAIIRGSNRAQDLRSWYSYHDEIFDHILTCDYTIYDKKFYFICLLDDNRLMNIVVPSNGDPITTEIYLTKPEVNLTESCIYRAQNGFYLTDGTSAYQISFSGKTCTKSTSVSVIPSAASIPYFTSYKTLGRKHVFIDNFSCMFIEHDLVSNISKVYYFTSNGSVQTYALAATLTIKGIDDLFVSARRANEFWFSATINKEPKSVVFRNIPNATFESWEAFSTSQAAADSWEVTVLKDNGYGASGFLTENCIFGPTGVFSIGVNGELHRFTRTVTNLDVGGVIAVDEQHNFFCGFDLTEKQICYAHESNRSPYLTRGTIKMQSTMRDATKKKFSVTLPIRVNTDIAAIYLETRDLNAAKHIRMKAIYGNGYYAFPKMQMNGASADGVVIFSNGTTVQTFIPKTVTYAKAENTPRITVEFNFAESNNLLTTNLFDGELVDYYVVGAQ